MILDAKLRVIYAYYQVTSTDEFELCRRNVSSDTYIVIDETERTIKEVGIKPWEKLFVRFRDATGEETFVCSNRLGLIERRLFRRFDACRSRVPAVARGRRIGLEERLIMTPRLGIMRLETL